MLFEVTQERGFVQRQPLLEAGQDANKSARLPLLLLPGSGQLLRQVRLSSTRSPHPFFLPSDPGAPLELYKHVSVWQCSFQGAPQDNRNLRQACSRSDHMPFQKCRYLPICEALDSCSNIDTITVNPISLLSDITKVYPDPENHLGVLREIFIFGFQDILDPLHSRREKGGLSTHEFCPSLRGRPGYFKF